MNVVRLLPVFLSALLLAAHFLRAGLLSLVVLSLAFPTVLVFSRRWAARLVQGILVLAATEWIRTLLINVSQHQADGRPWTRLVIILGLVAVFTAASALVFYFRHLKEKYKLSNPIYR